jgi:methyl-accepting chemotaxis protein
MEMDKVVQKNAANAEESAAAAEEMNAQAAVMKGFVGDLVALVGVQKNGSDVPKEKGLLHNRGNREELVSHLPGNGREKTWAAPAAEQRKGTTARRKELKPEQVLPLEENFKEF